MKKILSLLLLAIVASPAIHAQVNKTLNKVIELEIVGEDGANGAGVAWHPGQKKYYAAIAGNETFPLGVFDEKGKRLSDDEQKTLFDIRGIWYNPNTKTIQMNGYNGAGPAEYKLNPKGMPAEILTLTVSINQPHAQSAGAYDTKLNLVYFLNADDEGYVEVYNFKDGSEVKTIPLTLGLTQKNVDDDGYDKEDNYWVIEDYNSSTVIFTGIAGAELGLFNHYEKQVELYNKENGHLTQTLKLPEDSPVPDFLNFSYCNGIYWFFDKDTRVWVGYK
jgi:hypothetical protein